MAQSALIAKLDNLQSELNAAYARNQRLVVAVDEISRLSLVVQSANQRLCSCIDELTRVHSMKCHENALLVNRIIELEAVVAQLRSENATTEEFVNKLNKELFFNAEQREDMLAGELGRALQREADLQAQCSRLLKVYRFIYRNLDKLRHQLALIYVPHKSNAVWGIIILTAIMFLYAAV
ncbi:hypothetical protein CAEBREN_08049 [Caenorhabditis brenneri]|uniref:Uncharacterized protein n=1 Tax=Caenorhabditis brenneri TaxID=135651 RepID=G0NXD6_CAEBE|nr:hypothetical protein CAEBREN_08049 [Caenorhabditis brenneri]